MSPSYKVALYNLNDDTELGHKLHEVLTGKGIPSSVIETNDLAQKVGYIAGIEGYNRENIDYTGEPIDSPFMIMCNMPEAVLDSFLDAMMAAKVRINYKAVVTDHNKDYTCKRLLEDISREHELMQSWIYLDKLVKKSASLPPAIYSKKRGWQDLQNVTKMAQVVLNRDSVTKDQLDRLSSLLTDKYSVVTNNK